jgi:DNA primase
MDKYQLQKLRDLPIEGVAERLGLRVVRHKALCPFHDDHHASLSFSVRRNTFRCFVCGAHGGTIDLVMRCENKPFLDACRWLADEHNVIIDHSPFTIDHSAAQKEAAANNGQCSMFNVQWYERFFERPWLNDEARRFLYEERRLDPRVVRWCRLTSWRDKQGTPWLQTPYYNREGQLVGVQNRNLSPAPVESGEKKASPMGGGGRGLPRFRFPQGSECGIYNLPVLNLLKPGDELYITEGCSDCWAMLSAGHKAIAIPSATLLKKKDAEQLSIIHCQLSIVPHMYPDRDEPGERLFLQLRELLPNLQHHQLPPGCKDFSEYYLKEVKE